MREAVIYGGGGHARELLFQLRAIGASIVAMIDDLNPSGHVYEVPVRSFAAALELHANACWHVAIGRISARAEILTKLRRHDVHVGGFVSPQSVIAATAQIAPTAQIFAGTVVSDACCIEDDVIIHFGCVVSHDVTIGRNSFLAPRSTIAGNVTIGRSAWIGVGSTIKNGLPNRPLKIGDEAVIGAGACVVNDVAAGATMVGVPARRVYGAPE